MTTYHLRNESGIEVFTGTISPAPGGGSQPIQTGSGDPSGTVTPTGIGYLYIDTTNGGVWIATGATSADWIGVGGNANADGGVTAYSGGLTVIEPASGNHTVQGNPDGSASYNGTGGQVGIDAVSGVSFYSNGANAFGFNTAPIPTPVVPLTTPGIQDVIDALVALGLIAQSD